MIHPLTHSPPLLEWRASAKVDHERSAHWYLFAGILALSMIVYGILTGSWTMSVAIALASGLYFLVRNEKHPEHLIRIFQAGIEFDGRFRSWQEWKHFWILMGKGYAELHVAPKGFSGDLVIQTGTIEPTALQHVLIEHLTQIEKREGILDAVARFCKL